jgi:hypothetical protein
VSLLTEHRVIPSTTRNGIAADFPQLFVCLGLLEVLENIADRKFVPADLERLSPVVHCEDDHDLRLIAKEKIAFIAACNLVISSNSS